MAKKAAKKTARKTTKNGASKSARGAAKKSAKKTGGKSVAGAGGASAAAGKKTGKKTGKKKAASRADALAPRPINSGRGATPAEIGQDLVNMVNAGVKEEEIWAKWFHPKFVSIEGGNMNMAWHGRRAAKSKADWWYSNHKVHSMKAKGPYIGATGFGVKFNLDVEEISTGKRWQGDELAFYSVLNGKVVQEEFMGKPMPAGDAAPTEDQVPI
ncbi:MAG TPA: SnoaL-like domain-containing protein [Phycisphaerales bacterium]|nr:SnoaL-like domain-containing protein [Phycisphaerales bacterium]